MQKRTQVLAAAMLLLLPVAASSAVSTTDPVEVPFGLPAIPYPADNPFSETVRELGKQLFFDPVLSIDRTVSCASCHQPEHGFSSPEALPPGVLGQRALRHAPTLFNRAYGKSQRWDGKTATLEEQVLLPIADPLEMGLAIDSAVERLQADAAYRAAFEDAFAQAPSAPDLARALAGYVRHLLLAGSPVDRFRAGDGSALTQAERTGLWLFESKGRCWKCHGGANFTDEKFHNTGVGVHSGQAEEGRFAVTGRAEDRGRFKTPTLRGAALRGPFMHDGSLATLREVVEFYAQGGEANPGLDPDLERLDLSPEDVDHLVAFLKALSRKSEESAR
jgi:cytochrome c peroxidase